MTLAFLSDLPPWPTLPLVPCTLIALVLH